MKTTNLALEECLLEKRPFTILKSQEADFKRLNFRINKAREEINRCGLSVDEFAPVLKKICNALNKGAVK